MAAGGAGSPAVEKGALENNPLVGGEATSSRYTEMGGLEIIWKESNGLSMGGKGQGSQATTDRISRSLILCKAPHSPGQSIQSISLPTKECACVCVHAHTHLAGRNSTGFPSAWWASAPRPSAV